jgi:hypothetical protein
VERFEFVAELWLHRGDGAWHFITVPGEISDEVEARTVRQRRGFGSVRVQVTVGETTWSTSLFPDAKRGAYVLPVKKEVRRQEGISAGRQVAVTLLLLEE